MDGNRERDNQRLENAVAKEYEAIAESVSPELGRSSSPVRIYEDSANDSNQPFELIEAPAADSKELQREHMESSISTLQSQIRASRFEVVGLPPTVHMGFARI